MSKRNHPAPASDRREAVCDATRCCHRNPEHCQRLACPTFRAATVASNAARERLVADLLAIDPSLTTAALMYAAGGGQ